MPHHLTLSQAPPLNHHQVTSGQLFPFAGRGFLICKMETLMDTCLLYSAMIVSGAFIYAFNKQF